MSAGEDQAHVDVSRGQPSGGQGRLVWGGGAMQGEGGRSQKQEHPLQNLPGAKVLTLSSGRHTVFSSPHNYKFLIP